MTVTYEIPEDRPFWPAVRRGLRQCCPNCGEGKILFNYLKLRETCPHCEADLSHARADDGPAYLTILIVGKIMIGAMLHIYFSYRPEPWVMAVTFTLGATLLALYLLPRLKGAIVGVQWAKRMHGF